MSFLVGSHQQITQS